MITWPPSSSQFQEALIDARLSIDTRDKDADAALERLDEIAAIYAVVFGRYQEADIQREWVAQSALCHCAFLATRRDCGTLRPKCGQLHISTAALDENERILMHCFYSWITVSCQSRCDQLLGSLQVIEPPETNNPCANLFATSGESLCLSTTFAIWSELAQQRRKLADKSAPHTFTLCRGFTQRLDLVDILQQQSSTPDEDKRESLLRLRESIKRESDRAHPQQAAANRLSLGKTSVSREDVHLETRKACATPDYSDDDDGDYGRRRHRRVLRKPPRSVDTSVKTRPPSRNTPRPATTSHVSALGDTMNASRDGAPSSPATDELSSLLSKPVKPEALKSLLASWWARSQATNSCVVELSAPSAVSSGIDDVLLLPSVLANHHRPSTSMPASRRSAEERIPGSAPRVPRGEPPLRSASPRSHLWSATTTRRPGTVPTPLPFIKIARDWTPPPPNHLRVLRTPFLRDKVILDRRVADFERQQRSRQRSLAKKFGEHCHDVHRFVSAQPVTG